MDIFDMVIGSAYMFLLFIVSSLIMTGMFLNRLPKLVARLLGLIGVAVAVISLYFLYLAISASYNGYLVQSACVSELVALGVERKDIITYDSTCSRR